ncbi:MAG: DUF4124 domain-containing protein [Proteobacteria bacterium]|nr:DUF4124 domain-containing protein [Pseudomonadota bacterium]
MVTKIKIMVMISCCFTISQALAAIYQWRDENGQVHFSQLPPTDTTATEISPSIAPSSSAAQEKIKIDKLIKSQQEAEEKAKTDQEKTLEQEKTDKLRAVNCDRAKKHLEEMEGWVRIRLEDASGRVTQLTPEQRQAEIDKTKAAVQEYCFPKNKTNRAKTEEAR